MKTYTDKKHRIIYQYDATVKKIKRMLPNKIIFVENEKDVITIIRKANKDNIPIYIRGNGTSVVGNSITKMGGNVISMEKMNKIKNFNKISRLINVESGITIYKINKFLRKYGYFIPAFPASYKFSTIGGNIASNACGMESIRYGVIGDYVKKFSLITGNGKHLNIGENTIRSSLGMDLKKLFIGSFGQLGVITEITLSFVPIPQKIYKYFTYVKKGHEILDIMRYLYENGIQPIQFEVIDNRIMYLLQNNNNYYIEIISSDKIKMLSELKGESIRKSMSPIMSSMKKYKISLDLSFSLNHFLEFDKLIEQLKEMDEDIIVAYYSHFGDGIFHVNICYNKKDELIEKIIKKLYNFISNRDGAISGEHGYGYIHREWVKKKMKNNLKYIREIKKMFDPKNILNRGLEL